jgi:hypothetical protein
MGISVVVATVRDALDYYGFMIPFPRSAAAALLAATLFAQAALAQSTVASDAPTEPQSALTAELFYQLLLGELNAIGGEPGVGFSIILDAARKTGDARLFKRATELAIQSRAGPAALEATRAWRHAFPQSAQAGQYELQVLIVLGRVAETEEPARHFLATLPTRKN